MESRRHITIEQTALLQKETRNEDFAAHFYMTRYESLEGVPMASPEELLAAVTKAIKTSIGDKTYELAQIKDNAITSCTEFKNSLLRREFLDLRYTNQASPKGCL